MNDCCTESPDGANISDNSSTTVAGFPYESMEVFYQRQLPGIVALNRYFTIVWYVIGFPGNFLALAVWIQPRMRHSSGCYLAALAAADFLFLALRFVFELQTSWDIPVLDRPGLCESFPVIFYATQYLSPLLVLAFTVERYLCRYAQGEGAGEGRRLYIFKVFIEYPLNLGSDCISVFP